MAKRDRDVESQEGVATAVLDDGRRWATAKLTDVAAAATAAGHRLHEDGATVLAGYLRDAATRVDRLATDLGDRNASELIQAAVGFARRRPGVTLGVGLAAGFLIARLLTARGRHRTREE